MNGAYSHFFKYNGIEVLLLNDNLLKRLDQIGNSLAKYPKTLALIGHGSVGVELSRLDLFSDLDFFVVVEDDQKNTYIDSLFWLEEVHPLAYRFKNTNDGYKFMFSDGIYGEFAVFGRSEMAHVTQNEGRIVWKREDYEEPHLLDKKGNISLIEYDDADFRINEALTNLYVGLLRAQRGEKLSALRFIESYAFSNLMSVLHLFIKEEPVLKDPFNLERRFEHRYPSLQKQLEKMLQGYAHLALSAEAILDYILTIYPANIAFTKEIRVQIEKLKVLESK
jgi:hypothetical protein